MNQIESVSVVYFDNHTKISEAELGSSDPRLKKFVDWLHFNRDGWKKYYATVAPGKMLIKGKGFSLNVGENWVILNYEKAPDNYEQLSKSITSEELSFISKSAP
ncbi:hypothetical protein QFX18_19220 [Saccharophagus degradans]|uniref:hypothetical protein n=1 Tax=Saccharophagus degradans TaxID=86304 RepID=UPI002478221C|nr:hypothetical protein [Saccharophagus degradans]WGO98141.1 hypothetical protein QFX18_19220 [Saccharophagus degradans]